MNSQLVTAVGIAHAYGRVWPSTEARLKRIAVPLVYSLKLPQSIRDRVLRQVFDSIHQICRLRPFRISGGSLGDTFENDLIKLIFNGTAIANLADNAATSPLTSLYLALHTADPGDSGAQTTNEIAYTSYARAAVSRNSGGFTCSANQATLTSIVGFPPGTGGAGTATYFSVGTAASSTGKILFSGSLSPSITCGDGVTPQLGTGTTFSLD